MKREEKIRTVVSILIYMILAYFALGYIYELYQTDINSIMTDPDNIHNINIDGTDVTPVFRLLGTGLNIFVSIITTGLYSAIILIVGLILLIPFRLIGLNKKRKISQKEYKINKCAFIIILALSTLTGGIATRFTLILPLVFFNFIWGIQVIVFIMLPLFVKANSSTDNSR